MYRHLKGCILCGILFIFSSQSKSQTNKPVANTQPPAATTIRLTPIAHSPQINKNYVRVREAVQDISDANAFNSATALQVHDNTQYFDGLGRPLQTVAKGFSPNMPNKDLVTPIDYDIYGRQIFQYLPYAASTSDGNFKFNAFPDQNTFNLSQYPGEEVFYSKTIFENSPLNRPIKTFAPGNSWAGSEGSTSEKCIRYEYLINTISDSVRIWSILNNALTYNNNDQTTNIPNLGTPDLYGPGQLFKNILLDENGYATVEYKDKSEKVILKKVQVGNVPTDFSGYNNFLCTYYIYDDLDQLRFVIPPKALEAIKNSWVLPSDVINELCFRYEYDVRGRMIAKKIPGSGWQYIIYDNRDRAVYSQDANMRVSNKWMTTQYDELNRPVLTGIISFIGNPSALQQFVNQNPPSNLTITHANTIGNDLYISQRVSGTLLYQAQQSISFTSGFESESAAEFTTEFVSSSGGSEIVQYTGSPLPPNNNLVLLTITYYDAYQWTNKSFTEDYNYFYFGYGQSPRADEVTTQASSQTRGMVTGSKVRVIEDPNNFSGGKFLENVNFYDVKGRIVQTQSDNYKGGNDIYPRLYNFTNSVISNVVVHNNPAAGLSGFNIYTVNYYRDHADRVGMIEHGNILNYYDYDYLGRLKKADIGTRHEGDSYPFGNIAVSNYDYNIRGWLKGINRDYVNDTDPNQYFGFELNYDVGFQQNQFNGNIGGIKWRSRGAGEHRAYGFGYDQVNRLLFADFNQKFGISWEKSDPSIPNYLIDFSVKMGNGTDASTAYDENGNIKAMKQWGLKLNSSSI
ncbi:MAG: hypothetical protein H7X99_05215, partial [Saprospiraceae bacterium]|nr:hypothetical protein [Saprospiraceae bacterium]